MGISWAFQRSMVLTEVASPTASQSWSFNARNTVQVIRGGNIELYTPNSRHESRYEPSEIYGNTQTCVFVTI